MDPCYSRRWGTYPQHERGQSFILNDDTRTRTQSFIRLQTVYYILLIPLFPLNELYIMDLPISTPEPQIYVDIELPAPNLMT